MIYIITVAQYRESPGIVYAGTSAPAALEAAQAYAEGVQVRIWNKGARLQKAAGTKA